MTVEKHVSAVVLAAGKGTRMKSHMPKVLHPITGLPMLGHVLGALETSGIESIVLVVSPDGQAVADYGRSARSALTVCEQSKPLGTGDAVRAALPALEGAQGLVVVVFGDTPLIRPETLSRLKERADNLSDLVVLGFQTKDPAGYGRLILDGSGQLERIVEEKDATAAERSVTLCNGGAMAVRAAHLAILLEAIDNDNANGEYYLTQLPELARERGLHVSVTECPEEEILGVNSRQELARAEAIAQERLRQQAMTQGVTMLDPATTYLSFDTRFEKDVVIEPNVFFGPGVSVAEGARVRAFSHLEQAQIGQHTDIGPFARIRPGAQISERAKIGNFVEVKKAVIGPGAKANHLSYIGDAEVGAGANIGAGTITCNYDGYNKSRTEIGEGAFIGSNTTLIAPVAVDKGAYVGAGSVITKQVSADALALGRARQAERPGWAAAFHSRNRETGGKKDKS